MQKVPKKYLVLIILVLLPVSQAGAINLGRVVYDSENPVEVTEDSFNNDNPGVNFGLCAGFDGQSLEECLIDGGSVSEPVEYSPEPETESPKTQDAEESDQEPGTKVITIIKHVYEDPPQSDDSETEDEATDKKQNDKSNKKKNNDREDDEDEEEGKVLGVTAIRDTVQPVLDQLSAKVTDLEDRVEKTGTSLQNIILIILVVILSILTLRTEIRFQKLADKYDQIKKQIQKRKR